MRHGLFLLAAGVLTGCAGPAAAQQGSGWSPSAEAGVASDYLFRGVDQTHGRGEGFLSVDAAGPSQRLGGWVSNVATAGPHGAETQAEADLYGGWLTGVQGFDLETGATAYVFSGAESRPDLLELYARLARTLGPARFTASADYGVLGEGGAHDGDVELKGEYPLGPKWAVSAVIGHLYQDRPDVLDAFARDAAPRSFNATTWGLGASYSLTERVAVELHWSDVDHRGLSYPDRIFATVRARLF